MYNHKITLTLPRSQWAKAAALIEDILAHCKLCNLHCIENPQPRATETLTVHTENIDLETAFLICHRLVGHYTVDLHIDELSGHDPIRVEPRHRHSSRQR